MTKRKIRPRQVQAPARLTEAELTAMTPAERVRHDIAQGRLKRQAEERARLKKLRHEPPEPDETVNRLARDAEKQRELAGKLDRQCWVGGDRRWGLIQTPAGVEARKKRREYVQMAEHLDRQVDRARKAQLERWEASKGSDETYKLARLRDEKMERVDTTVAEWVREEDGSLAKGEDGLPVLRSEEATALQREGAYLETQCRPLPLRDRLRRVKGVEGDHIAAAERLERDWLMSVDSEPRLTLDPDRSGGVRRVMPEVPTIEELRASHPLSRPAALAKTRTLEALHQLEIGGENVRMVIEQVIGRGRELHDAAPRMGLDSNATRGRAKALGYLIAALTVLTVWYAEVDEAAKRERTAA